MASLFNFLISFHFFVVFFYLTVISSGGGVPGSPPPSARGIFTCRFSGKRCADSIPPYFMVSFSGRRAVKIHFPRGDQPTASNSVRVQMFQMSSSNQESDLVNLVCRLLIMTKSGTSKESLTYMCIYLHIHISIYICIHIHIYINIYIYTLKFSLSLLKNSSPSSL